MNKQRFLTMVALALLVGVLAAALALPAAATGATRYTAVVSTHPSRGPVQVVEGASATLVTNDSGAAMTLQTSQLVPGNAYTVWGAIVNNPTACLTHPCTATDVLFRTAIVQAEVAYAAGHVVGGSGWATSPGIWRPVTCRAAGLAMASPTRAGPRFTSSSTITAR